MFKVCNALSLPISEGIFLRQLPYKCKYSSLEQVKRDGGIEERRLLPASKVRN